MIRLALFLLMGRRRRLLALLGLAFVAIRFVYRRRRRKNATDLPSSAHPISGTSTTGVVGKRPGYEITTVHLRQDAQR